jgi:hypothetical protein
LLLAVMIIVVALVVAPVQLLLRQFRRRTFCRLLDIRLDLRSLPVRF